jgi:16S rRNA (guanine527-N7)-methyltransferase
MIELFNKYDINLNPEQISLFDKFLELFVAKNSVMNLSAIRDNDGIIVKHFIDSLMLTKFTSLSGKVADI